MNASSQPVQAPVTAAGAEAREASMKRRVRNGALGLAALALAFYVGFIVLLVHHSHH
jgi:hypothetical protein